MRRGPSRWYVWAQLAKLPAGQVAGADLREDVVVLDVDATLVTAHTRRRWRRRRSRAASAITRSPSRATTHRDARRVAAAGQRRRERRRGPHRGAGRGDRPGRGHAPAAPAGARRRRRRLHGLLDWLVAQDAKRGGSVEYSVGFAV